MAEDLAAKILSAAVQDIGGTTRPGQQAMVEAVDESLRTSTHLLIQAGTGTGKSIGYLAPLLADLTAGRERAVIATATLALQRQLAEKDVPAALDATERVTGKRPTAAVLKGRTNHACLLRAREGGVPGQGTLLDVGDLPETTPSEPAPSNLGKEVLALREWVEQEADRGGLADRDDAPTHTAAAWQQVSIPTRECLGVAACPFGAECFVEASRSEARSADLVITNHAMLAVNAMHGGTALPEHSVLVVDEAHQLTARVTTAATDDLSPGMLESVGRRALPWLDDDLGMELLDCADELRSALEESELTRIQSESASLILAMTHLSDVTRRVVTALGQDRDDPDRTQTHAAIQEIQEIAARFASLRESDVVWVTESESFGRFAHAAPLSVSGLLREAVLGEATTILTSATLSLGGEFSSFANSIGLAEADLLTSDADPEDNGDGWRAKDMGSPFDYSQQGILYATRRLPRPGRDGLSEEVLAEIAQLVWAADGRALGLFASRRNAEQAAHHCRSELPDLEILCQGDAQLPELQRRFSQEPRSSLFGTLSLWQGVDIPGDACQLVLIDKIPFPRPDEPLLQARKQAIDEAGGNGFMRVAASHAALLLAQGAGRLIRRHEDRGVVAVLDPRLVTQRYGSFLLASMPPFWRTTNPDIAVRALRRLRGEE